MDERGFSLVEVLVATALTLTVTAVAFAVVRPSQQSFSVRLESIDMQQRLRVATGALYRDIALAGAGAARGPTVGSLAHYFAPVRPYRYSVAGEDPPGTFRTDAITLMSVAAGAPQTTLAASGALGSPAEIALNLDPGCPHGDALCGFRSGMAVVLFDSTGRFDRFVVSETQANVLLAERIGDSFAEGAYAAGISTVARLTSVVYYLKSDPATKTYQLMSHDGGAGGDAPVIDHLVALEFQYYGEAAPPALNGRDMTDPAGPWTTYGPAPPPADGQIPGGGYPPGENCAFSLDPSGLPQPRLATLGPPGARVPLTNAELTDGPWCPDPASPNRWDADLLRIRKIGVRLRVQAAEDAFRGPAGVLFSNGGTSTGGHAWLPDREMEFDVSPRNLGILR
jgi:hypothetical protein